MTKGDELVEQLRREGGARALYQAAAIIQAAGFVNADGYFRWLRDAAENVLEGKELDARRPRDPVLQEVRMSEDGSRVLRDLGWRPANADSMTTHELFQMTQGDWYCTGCQWAFTYRVSPARALEVWRNSPQHEVPEPEEVPPKMYITEMRRRVDDNVEGDVMFGRDEMAHALNTYDQVVTELNMLKGVIEKVAMLPGQWVANAQSVAPGKDWSSWETRRQDASTYAHELAEALGPENPPPPKKTTQVRCMGL